MSKQTRPRTGPIPIRFTENQLSEIETTAEELQMSRQDIIRLSCSAGILALKKLGTDGLAQAIANLLTEAGEPPENSQPSSSQPSFVKAGTVVIGKPKPGQETAAG